MLSIHENRKKFKLGNNTFLQRSIIDDLIFPLLFDTIVGYNDFYGISQHVDHDLASGVKDYNCLSKSYNGHKGTGFYTLPFGWHLYEKDLVKVISMFDGTIILKQDGNRDTNCSPNGEWNAVYIQHTDGSTMWYGHLKEGSLTSKSVGDIVQKGEYLGVVASSGFSTGPHLHIEYYDENDNLVDPFKGNCNTLISDSLWDKQPAYSNPKINAVLTHALQPVIECGPENEFSSFKNEFLPNQNIYVGVYLTDYIAGEVAVTNIYRPDNTLFDSFNTFNNQNSFDWFWNSRGYFLTEADPFGTWTVECLLGNISFMHSFEYGGQATATTKIPTRTIEVYPNPSNNYVSILGVENYENGDFKLLDLNGSIIKIGLLKNELRLIDVPKGLYLLIIEIPGVNIIPKKIIKY